MKVAIHQRLGAYGALATFAIMGGTFLPRCTPPPPPVSAAIVVAGECTTMVNNERAAAGLAPVAENASLDTAAIGQAKFQATRRTMTHTGQGGTNVGQRLLAVGYTPWTWAENVAYGYGSCAAVMSGWMDSPGHRANILNPQILEIGMGAVADTTGVIYWTMDLATVGG
jgi:uncharacterized protein YkwD